MRSTAFRTALFWACSGEEEQGGRMRAWKARAGRKRRTEWRNTERRVMI